MPERIMPERIMPERIMPERIMPERIMPENLTRLHSICCLLGLPANIGQGWKCPALKKLPQHDYLPL